MNSIEKYKEETKEKLKQLFKEAEEKDSEKFLRAFFAIDTKRYPNKIMSYISSLEFKELLDLLKTFNKIVISDKVDKNTRTRLRLFLYCRILEVDLPYMIIANIVRIIAGEPYDSRLYLTTKKGEIKVCEYPWQKIKYLNDLGKKAGLDLSTIWNRFFHDELRNAFSHSQYCLRNRHGDVFLTSAVSPTTQTNKTINKEYYTYAEVEYLYLAAYSYLEVFIEITNQFMAKYKT